MVAAQTTELPRTETDGIVTNMGVLHARNHAVIAVPFKIVSLNVLSPIRRAGHSMQLNRRHGNNVRIGSYTVHTVYPNRFATNVSHVQLGVEDSMKALYNPLVDALYGDVLVGTHYCADPSTTYELIVELLTMVTNYLMDPVHRKDLLNPQRVFDTP